MMEKFKAYSFNEPKKIVTLEGTIIDNKTTGLGFGINVTIKNDVALYFDNVTGMILYGEEATIKSLTKDHILRTINKAKIRVGILDAHENFFNQGIIMPGCTEKLTKIFPKSINLLRTKSGENNHAVALMNTFNLYNYFLIVSAYDEFGNQTMGTDSLVIKPMNFVFPAPRTKEVVSLNGIIDLHDLPSIDCVWDEHNTKTRRWNVDKVIVFKVGKYDFAEYIPDVNVLVMKDILCTKSVEWLGPFFELLKKNYLKKIDYSADQFTIGCDPEFELYDNSGNLMTGDAINVDGRLQNKIGADGHAMQLELRPIPHTNITRVIDDLAELFKSVSHLNVSVEGNKEAIGGHIHFGAPRGKVIGNYDTLTLALDFFIGSHFKALNGKARGNYGRFSDTRPQPWGFEYRTPPAAIFATKEIAYTTCKLAKGIAEALVDRDIQSKVPFDIEDLKQFLTEDEARYYIDFPSNYNSYPKNIVFSWCDTSKLNAKNPVFKSPVEIIFHDEWDPSVKEYYRKNIKDSICDAPITIHLYGLKGRQNRTTGLGTTTPHPKGIYCNEGIAIGLSDSYRQGESSNAITRMIKNKILKIVGTKLERTTAVLFPEELIGSNFTGDLNPNRRNRNEEYTRGFDE